MKLMKQVHDLPSGLGIQCSCRFIGKNDSRIIGHGSCNGNTLLLSAGKLVRPMRHTVSHADLYQ